MKATLIFHMALPCLLVCFSSTGFSQQASPMQFETSHPRENITGVGTTTIVYHLLPNYKVKSPQELTDFVLQHDGVINLTINPENLVFQFEDVNKTIQVDLILSRIEMLYLTEETNTKN